MRKQMNRLISNLLDHGIDGSSRSRSCLDSKIRVSVRDEFRLISSSPKFRPGKIASNAVVSWISRWENLFGTSIATVSIRERTIRALVLIPSAVSKACPLTLLKIHLERDGTSRIISATAFVFAPHLFLIKPWFTGCRCSRFWDKCWSSPSFIF